MLSEWVITEPARGSWPEFEWARALRPAEAGWLLAMYGNLFPGTSFEVREVTYQ
jgi:hypothetical protein